MTDNTPSPPKRQEDTGEPLTLTVDELARKIRISRQHAYDMVQSGEIPSVRLGRRILIPARVINEMFR